MLNFLWNKCIKNCAEIKFFIYKQYEQYIYNNRADIPVEALEMLSMFVA